MSGKITSDQCAQETPALRDDVQTLTARIDLLAVKVASLERQMRDMSESWRRLVDAEIDDGK